MNHNLTTKQVNLRQIYAVDSYRLRKNSVGEYGDGYSTNGKKSSISAKTSTKTYSFNQILAQTSVDFAELSPFLEIASLKKDEVIHQYGDQINYVYFPETSVVSEYQILEDGRMTEIAMIGKEGVTGLEVILDSSMAKNWMRISVPGKALRIKAKAFKDEFNYNERFRKVILNYINYYLEQTSQRIICTCYHLAEKRFCSWLLMLQDRSENRNVLITHEQISQFIGTQRATVSRIIHLLREEKIIKSGRGNITILDRQRLEEMACSCYETSKRVF
jgi:CRP-like cAMP-binding protein